MTTAVNLPRAAATRYVLPLREGGSLPALVEADDDGMYVLKLRGAGQRVKALVAELLVGELARACGLPVPEIALVELDRELAAAEPDPEIQELLQASAGLNVGLDFLPGALPFAPGAPPADLDAELAAAIVWLDALTLNVDRSPRNPNLLTWHDRLWLIDHGAALYPHHAAGWPEGAADCAYPQVAEHVLLGLAGSIGAAHERLAPVLGRSRLAELAALIPDELLGADPVAERAAYVEVVDARLRSGAFAVDAEAARRRLRADG